MKKTLISLLTLLCLLTLGGKVQAAEQTEAMLKFEAVQQLPKDTTVAVPVYLNTQGKELNSLQLKIDVTGNVKDLSVTLSSKLPVQEISKEVMGKSIFVSVTSLDLGKGWNTTEDTELLSLSFSHKGDGEVQLSFDPKETLAGSTDSDDNVLTIGKAAVIKMGEVMPVETTPAEEEMTPSITEAVMEPEEEMPAKSNNSLLVGLIIGSFAAALLTLGYILNSQKKDKKAEETKQPFN